VKNIWQKRGSKHFQAIYSLPHLLAHLAWYFLHAGVFLLAAAHSPGRGVMEEHPRLVMYTFGFQYILLALRFQLAGVTQERFNPFRRTTILTWAVLIAQVLHVRVKGTTLMDEGVMYGALALASFLTLAHFIYNVTIELRDILGINLLTLTDA
jgi:hypothetical protein